MSPKRRPEPMQAACTTANRFVPFNKRPRLMEVEPSVLAPVSLR